MLLTVHQINCSDDADHEENAHRNNENGDLTSLSTDWVRFRFDVGTSKSIHYCEMSRWGDRNLIEVFGFWLWMSWVDVDHWMVLSLWLFVGPFEWRFLLHLRKVFQICNAQKQRRCTLIENHKKVTNRVLISKQQVTYMQTVNSVRWRALR